MRRAVLLPVVGEVEFAPEDDTVRLPRVLGPIATVALPVLFTAYLVYGFIRPKLSRRLVHEIEEEEDDETNPPV